MRVKGMQKKQSIRSLIASDSRNILVTVLILLFLISTMITRVLPSTLSKKIKEYRKIRTVWPKSGNEEKRGGKRRQERKKIKGKLSELDKAL